MRHLCAVLICLCLYLLASAAPAPLPRRASSPSHPIGWWSGCREQFGEDFLVHISQAGTYAQCEADGTPVFVGEWRIEDDNLYVDRLRSASGGEWFAAHVGWYVGRGQVGWGNTLRRVRR